MLSHSVSFFCSLYECESQTHTPQHNQTTTKTKPTAQNLTGLKEEDKKKRGRNSPEKELVFWVLRHVHKISEGKNTQT